MYHFPIAAFYAQVLTDRINLLWLIMVEFLWPVTIVTVVNGKQRPVIYKLRCSISAVFQTDIFTAFRRASRGLYVTPCNCNVSENPQKIR